MNRLGTPKTAYSLTLEVIELSDRCHIKLKAHLQMLGVGPSFHMAWVGAIYHTKRVSCVEY